MADEIQMHGLQELKATLKDLPDRLGAKVVRGALRASAQVIRKDAQARVPILEEPNTRRKPGTVRKAVQVRRSKKDKYGVFVGVKPLGGKQLRDFKAAGGKSQNNPDDPWYWIFLEFGTAKMPAAPFLRPAFETQHPAALSRFEEYAKQRVVKEAEKLAREKGMR
ncbi:HK97-gp10 family putative phage morphogenesis protein [Azotobacter chroococcum]|uniref:HK97-gp10 family putative phage morphogenesis protein n=1 Tax=Azotobacter chroococcum TaxID=353 RepID=UPI000B7901A8|nr:HK97-gp10 family putative phage morphogenesis protein [Azotobacter chroococcum]